MKSWHQTLAANVGLRIGGVLMLGVGWVVTARLHHLALRMPLNDTASMRMLLAAAAFICWSAGSLLLLVGPKLWEPVDVSERWRRLPASLID